jgi:hypothetical protein
MINEAPKLNEAKREAGGKILHNLAIAQFPNTLLCKWEALSEDMREANRKMFEEVTAPLRLQVARQAEEMADLWEIYLKSYELAGGKPDGCLVALPVLVNRLRRLIIRAECGCIALDCVKHGSYVAEDVDFWETIIKSPYPAYERPSAPAPTKPPEEITRG